MNALLEVTESSIPIRKGEELAYYFDISPYASSASSISTEAQDRSDETDAVAGGECVLTGSASAAGTIMTTPKIRFTVSDREYWVTIQFTDGSGNKWRPVLRFYVED